MPRLARLPSFPPPEQKSTLDSPPHPAAHLLAFALASPEPGVTTLLPMKTLRSPRTFLSLTAHREASGGGERPSEFSLSGLCDLAWPSWAPGLTSGHPEPWQACS